MTRAHRRPEGFTLLELLVAFGLTALLAVLFLDGIRFGQRAWERSAVATGAEDETLIVRGLLTEWLANAEPVVAEDGTLAFRGGPERIALVTTFGSDPAAETWTELVLETNPFAGTLAASWTWQGTLHRRVLLAGAPGLGFSYFDGAGGAWTTAWEGRDALPRLVRIAVTAPVGDGRAIPWPELVVATRLDLAVDCELAPSAGPCRGEAP